MSTPIHDGGPAFPHEANETVTQTVIIEGTSYCLPVTQSVAKPGMSLRDWFAGQALASRGMYGANVREKEVAAECYAIADAMIAEREKGAK